MVLSELEDGLLEKKLAQMKIRPKIVYVKREINCTSLGKFKLFGFIIDQKTILGEAILLRMCAANSLG